MDNYKLARYIYVDPQKEIKDMKEQMNKNKNFSKVANFINSNLFKKKQTGEE